MPATAPLPPSPTAGSGRRLLLRGGAALAAAGLPQLGLSLGAALGLARTARAQVQTPSAPQAAAGSVPWHLLNSGPPGSIPDTVARRVAEQLNRRDGQTVVVDNRPGAAGQLAVAALKAGPADGSTLLLAQGAIATVYPYLYPKLAYDPVLDLQPVSLAGEMTLALAVGPAVPATVADLPGLLAWLRGHPALANVGSPGTGTLPHLLAAVLMHHTGIGWQHIGYSGGPPAMVALLGGQIAALVLPEGLFSPHRAAGRLRVLATSGAQRSALMPDVPTLAEQGHPQLVVREWFAFFMASRVTPETVAARSTALRSALAQPALVAQFADAGMVAASSTPAALAARISAEQRYWEPVLRTLALRVE